MSHVSHVHMRHGSHISHSSCWGQKHVTQQVSFRKRATNYRALLRKTTHKDKASYASLLSYPTAAGVKNISLNLSSKASSWKSTLRRKVSGAASEVLQVWFFLFGRVLECDLPQSLRSCKRNPAKKVHTCDFFFLCWCVVLFRCAVLGVYQNMFSREVSDAASEFMQLWFGCASFAVLFTQVYINISMSLSAKEPLIIGLFCRKWPIKIRRLLCCAKETLNFKEPTNRSHPTTKDKALVVCFVVGWLRLVGSLKLWVSFAKEPYKRDYILQKRPTILRSLLNRSHPTC